MKLYLDGERERKVGNNHRRLLLGLSRLEIGPQDGGYEMDTWKLVSDFWIDSFLFFFFFFFGSHHTGCIEFFLNKIIII